MCHSADSRPPAPPVTTSAVAGHGPLELTAGDGNRFAAYRATPAAPNGSSIVLLPDRRGLHPFYEHFARLLAGTGFHVVAFDFFGRTAGLTPRDNAFDWKPHFDAAQPAHVDADADAAVARARADNPGGPVFTLGFCFGGGHSWRQAARPDLGLVGAIGFYGPLRLLPDDFAATVAAPLLMLIAGEDAATPQSAYDALAAELDAAGKPYTRHVYEGAPHSFFDVAHADWTEACTDAWLRLLLFTETIAKGVTRAADR